MLSVVDAADAIRRDLDEITRRLTALPEEGWATSTRCPGWTVLDLAAHVAAVAQAQGEAFHRMLAGSVDTPEVPVIPAEDDQVVLEALREGRLHLLEALDTLTPEHDSELVPLPFSTLPCSIAMVVPVIEYGFHRNDLEWALGDRIPLMDDVAATAIETLPGFLPMIETKPADEPVAYRLEAPSGAVTVAWTDGAWSVVDDTENPVCVIQGDDSDVALFALGRVGPDEADLTIEGDAETAARFKHFFPGP